MSGELTLSQFRLTTTENNDFVIGSLEDTPNPTSPRFLVFQTTKNAGWQFNPHIRFDPTQKVFLFSKDGTSVSQFILSDTVNTFTENNTFTKNVTVQGTFSSLGTTIIGDNAGTESLTVNAPATFTDSVTLNNPDASFIVNSLDVRIQSPTKFTQRTITVNSGGAAGSGAVSGIDIEENGISSTGYIRSTSNRFGISLKGPARKAVHVEGNATYDVFLTAEDATSIQTYKLPSFLGASSQIGILPAWQPGTAYTASRVLVSSAVNNKLVTISSITTTELGYLSGVNSNIQTSLINLTNTKMSISGGTFTGPVTFQDYIAVQSTSLFSGVATFNAGFTGNHSAGSLLSLSLPATAGSDGQTLVKSGTSWIWGTPGGGSFSLPVGFTTGDLLVGSGAGTAGRLAKGTEGQVLKVVGGVVTWGTDATGGGGSFDTAASYTLTGNWTFNNGIRIKDAANTDIYVLRINNGVFEINKL